MWLLEGGGDGKRHLQSPSPALDQQEAEGRLPLQGDASQAGWCLWQNTWGCWFRVLPAIQCEWRVAGGMWTGGLASCKEAVRCVDSAIALEEERERERERGRESCGAKEATNRAIHHTLEDSLGQSGGLSQAAISQGTTPSREISAEGRRHL